MNINMLQPTQVNEVQKLLNKYTAKNSYLDI